MKILGAIGRFFARIGRWIKETAWIQPLLIVGAIFAIIFAIPHIIDGVKGWFDESDAAKKFFASYQLSLKNADVIPEGKTVGSSKVDELFTYVEEGENLDKVKSTYGERFFIAFVKDSDNSCDDLYGGLKKFKDYFGKNAEFKDLQGSFKLHTIYMDKVSSSDSSVNLFDQVWLNHYSMFETMSAGGYLDQTFYAKNKNYTQEKYASSFTSDKLTECPMNSPMLMYFDFTVENSDWNQRIAGLSDVIFSVDGSSDLEKARTLQKCWSHTDIFGKLLDHE